mgnify:CR=1 FL=1
MIKISIHKYYIYVNTVTIFKILITTNISTDDKDDDAGLYPPRTYNVSLLPCRTTTLAAEERACFNGGNETIFPDDKSIASTLNFIDDIIIS